MIEILNVSASLIIMAVTITVIIYRMLKNDQNRRSFELKMQNKSIVLPIKLQAYERMALFLERITPESLIVREQNNQMNSLLFHSVLLKSIRTEYEHNVAMQVYITPATWKLIQTAKDEVIKLINSSAKETNPQSPSLAMGKAILENTTKECNYHLRKALEAIQQDIQQLG